MFILEMSPSLSLSLFTFLYVLHCFLHIRNSIGTTLTKCCSTILSTLGIAINSFLYIFYQLCWYGADSVYSTLAEKNRLTSKLLNFQILQPGLGSSHTSASLISMLCIRSLRRNGLWESARPKRARQMLHGLEQGWGLGSKNPAWEFPVSNSLSPLESPQKGRSLAGTFSALWFRTYFPNNFSFQDFITRCPVLYQCDAC